MGYTEFTISKLDKIISGFKPKTVLDFGSQQLYNQPKLPAPYASEWYDKQNIEYECIDLNGENDAWQLDLSKPFGNPGGRHGQQIGYGYDLLVDAGTSEHVRGADDKFSWEAIYNCWTIKHEFLKVGGVMYSENPKEGSWPLHGVSYLTQDFYHELAGLTDYEILDIGEHAACSNYLDGWNIFCTLRKKSNLFVTLDNFKNLSLYQK